MSGPLPTRVNDLPVSPTLLASGTYAGGGQRWRQEEGWAMVALLVGLSVMAVMMSVALPVWQTMAKREKEAEYVFRARQYARAVALFQRKYAGAYPPTVDVLVNEHYLRKKYKDPLTGEDFELVRVGSAQSAGAAPSAPNTGRPGAAGSTQNTPTRGGGGRITAQPSTSLGQTRVGPATAGGGGIMGVTSKSKDKSLMLYNGRDTYDQWVVLGTEASLFGGRGGNGSQTPTGGRNGGGAPGTGTRGGAPPGARSGASGRAGSSSTFGR